MQTALKDESPVLGQAAGVYREWPVLRSLQPHFQTAWFYHKPSGPARKTAIVPDACADLVWCGGNLIVAGTDRKVSFEPVPSGCTVVGLRFQPGTSVPWLRVPANEIVGGRIPLEDFSPNQAQLLLDSIGDTREPEGVAIRLQGGLDKIARRIDWPDRSPSLLLNILRSAHPSNGSITGWLTSMLGTSERTLRRHCERAFGYGPKTLDRVLRMQRFLELARIRCASNLVDLARAAGYADQAHLSREARRLTGLTPTKILSQIRRPNEPLETSDPHDSSKQTAAPASR